MTSGIKHWNKRFIRYDQTQNATEAIIKKVLAENKLPLRYLESCGAAAYGTNYEGMGHKVPEITIQFDDYVMMYLNDPKNKQFSSGNIFDNRVMRNYKKLYEEQTGKECLYKKSNWKEITSNLQQGNGVQLCLKNPGHYIACLAYDDTKNVILYSDSWSSRKGLKNKGWHEELTEHEYNTNVKATTLIYLQ